MNGSFPYLVIKHASCITLALISLRKATECSKISCKQQNLPNHDTYDFPANRGLGQRTPVSSVQIDRGLETERVRTSASTPALVPLFAVLIAALPVRCPCECLCFFSSSHQFLSFQVGFRNESCVEIGRENVSAWRGHLQVVTLHWRIFTTPSAISSLHFLPVCLRPPLFA